MEKVKLSIFIQVPEQYFNKYSKECGSLHSKFFDGINESFVRSEEDSTAGQYSVAGLEQICWLPIFFPIPTRFRRLSFCVMFACRIQMSLCRKKYLSSMVLADYALILAFYMLLAFTGIFAFKEINDLYTLNFQVGYHFSVADSRCLSRYF
jgi:hypothetical protein